VKEAYLKYVIAMFIRSKPFEELVGPDWIPEEEYAVTVESIAEEALKAFGYGGGGKNYAHISKEINEEFKQLGVIEFEGDEYSGKWFRFDFGYKNHCLISIISDLPNIDTIKGLGEGVVNRALKKIALEDGLLSLRDQRGPESDVSEASKEPPDAEAPASDRVVRLDDNQRSEIETPLSEVIDLVGKENSVDGEDGLRELILGKIQAGRELIRAGIFSLESFHLTLVVGLRMLVERYGDHAIGAAASKLLDLVLQQVGAK